MKKSILFLILGLILLSYGCSFTEIPISDASSQSENNLISNTSNENSIGSNNMSTDNIPVESSSESNLENSEVASDCEISEESIHESSQGEIPGEPLKGKFGQYAFTTENNSMKTLTIYSEGQIKDFNTRRSNGEWFTLSVDDIKYIVSETISFFEEYSIIQIRDLDGKVHKYYGVPYYGTDNYYACFNGFDIGDPNALYKLDAAVMCAVYERIKVLNSAVFDSCEENCILVLADAPILKHQDFEKIKNYYRDVYIYNKIQASPLQESYVMFQIGLNKALFQCIEDISNPNSPLVTLIDEPFFPNTAGRYKYDCLERNVIIEVWSETNRSMIARIRIDETRNPEEFTELVRRAKNISASSVFTEDKGQYRVAVFFNGISVPIFGMEFENFAFRYTPDGNIDLCSWNTGDYVFPSNYQEIKGISILTEYINHILQERLCK